MTIKNLKSINLYLLILIFSLACTTISRYTEAPKPSDKPAENPVEAITSGGMHSCALIKGAVYCWGYNDSGQIGDGTAITRSSATLVSDLDNVVAISAGGYHTCAVLNNGNVKCWGRNSSWQLGDGTNTLRNTPTDVKNLNGKAVAISAGDEHTCALMENREVKCWGKNLYGRLGIDSFARIGKTPETVKNLEGVVMISAGYEHTCALTSVGAVKCWGHNGFGAIGGNTDKNAKIPIDVVNLDTNILSITTGFGATYALDKNGNIKYWGWLNAQLQNTTPEYIEGFDENAIDVAAGTGYVCILTNEGAIQCLGENEYGQLGNGTTRPTYRATNVTKLPGKAIKISVGAIYACALVDNGDILCWGDNSVGQLGNIAAEYSTEPIPVIGFK
jgi:alpha-tubulin suppressor-like RCC1 family protein